MALRARQAPPTAAAPMPTPATKAIPLIIRPVAIIVAPRISMVVLHSGPAPGIGRSGRRGKAGEAIGAAPRLGQVDATPARHRRFKAGAPHSKRNHALAG